jgi:hypothetical protein
VAIKAEIIAHHEAGHLVAALQGITDIQSGLAQTGGVDHSGEREGIASATGTD